MQYVGVGKTCLLMRYTSDSFSPSAIYTIGIDFKVKNITVDGKKIKLQVCCNVEKKYFVKLTLPLDMGYCWTGKISNYNNVLFPWCTRYCISV